MGVKIVRVGVIGSGFGGEVHVPGFRSVKNARVSAIGSRRIEHARSIARRFSVPHVFSSWRQMIESDCVDAVSIATPPKLHEEIALHAFKYRKHVLCEKPLALNLKSAQTMRTAAKRSGLVNMIDFEFREIPAWHLMKELISSGALGALQMIRVQWRVKSWANPSRRWSWKSSLAQGGGVLNAMAVHTFDYLEWLFGPVHSLAANLRTEIPKRKDEFGRVRTVTAEDSCQITMRFNQSFVASARISQVALRTPEHSVMACGAKKTLILKSSHASDYGKGFKIYEAKPESRLFKSVKIPKRLTVRDQYDDGRILPFSKVASKFVNAILKKLKNVAPSFDQGVRSQALLDAARLSHSERRWVRMSELI